MYQRESNSLSKEYIFREHIYASFEKMAHDIIARNGLRFRGWNRQHIVLDTISYLYTKIYKYDRAKGNAYGYFTTIAFNYLRSVAKDAYNLFMSETPLDPKREEVSSKIDEVSLSAYEEQQYEESIAQIHGDLVSLYCENKAHILHNVTSQRSALIFDVILAAAKDRESCDDSSHTQMNKLRAAAGCSDQKPITRMLSKMRSEYKGYKHYAINTIMS